MKQNYYSADVKAYDPMGRQPMDGIDANIRSADNVNSNYSKKCLDYNPICAKSDYYQPGYEVKIFREISSQSSQQYFEQKEERVMNYQPGEIKNNNQWNFTISKGIFKGGSFFSRIFKNIIKTIRHWYQIFKRPTK